MKKILTILLLIILSLTATAQVNLDSLWNVWNDNTQADTSRLKAMKQIAWDAYLFTQPDSAFYFAQLQYDFAKAVNNKKYIASALHTQGVSFYFRGDYPKALDYYTKSLKIREELEDKKGIARSLGNIGIIYHDQGDYPKAIDYYTKSLKTFEELEDKKGIASSLNNIGVIYDDQGDYPKAIEYYTKSLKIDEELNYMLTFLIII